MDTKGRYWCTQCVEAVGGRGGERDAGADRTGQADQGAIPLERFHEKAWGSCPVCLRPMAPGTRVCAGCGYDSRQGIQSSTMMARPDVGRGGTPALTCRKCGYDLTGLTSLTCPECGSRVDLSGRLAYQERVARDVQRWAYLRPLIQLLVGVGAVSLIFLLRGSPELIPRFLVAMVIEVVLGAGLFYACCLLWIGFDAPFHLNALRLLGVFALAELVRVLVGFIPLAIVPYVIWIIVFAGLLADALELDFQDAIFVALLLFLMKIILGIVLVSVYGF